MYNNKTGMLAVSSLMIRAEVDLSIDNRGRVFYDLSRLHRCMGTLKFAGDHNEL